MGRSHQVKVESARYTRTAIALHWIIAVLILAMLCVGYYMTGLPRNTPERGFFFNLHKSFGLLAAAVILLRIIWRLRHAPPPDAPALPSWQRTAARINHLFLYVCLVLMPASGYLGSSFRKFGVKFFGIPLPHWGWEDKGLEDLFVGTHHLIAPIFIALIAVHTFAALYHAYLHDGVFARMWFGSNGRETRDYAKMPRRPIDQ